MRPIFAIGKRLTASNRVSFLLTLLVVLLATTSKDSSIALSNGNYTWLLAVITPFIFVFYDYGKLIHLGAGKRDYYLGCMSTYGVLALFISFVNTGIHLLIDPLNKTQYVINLMELCGWMGHGAILGLLQQAAFLFLVMVFLHMLLSMQNRWYGWVTDGVLVAIICVFIPIASLRQLLAGFFKLIMFNSNAIVHLSTCLALSFVFALTGQMLLKRKTHT